jgi:type IV secretory pathway VirB3-like protein
MKSGPFRGDTVVMANEPHFHPVYRSLNKPLTILGVERRLFFLALVVGAATFNFFGSLLVALLMVIVFYAIARWATATDPQIFRILLNSSRFKPRYDPAKFETFRVVRVWSDRYQPHR